MPWNGIGRNFMYKFQYNHMALYIFCISKLPQDDIFLSLLYYFVSIKDLLHKAGDLCLFFLSTGKEYPFDTK